MPSARILLHRREAAVPALLQDAARDARDALQQLIAASTSETAQIHAELFQQYRSELERLFLNYSTTPTPAAPDEDGTAEPASLKAVWNGTAIRRAGVQTETRDSIAQLLEAMQAVDVEAFQAGLGDAAEEGYQRELWFLALAGVEGAEGLLGAAPENWDLAALADGYGGLNWQERLAVWSATTSAKVGRQLNGALLTGWTWDSTADMLTRMAAQHTGHVTGLLGNELFRAFTLGGAIALGFAIRDLGVSVREIWVTRDDAQVCPICRAKHMTVTSDRPVDDSHPGCRCIKVPVPSNFTPVAPLSFESFRGDR